MHVILFDKATQISRDDVNGNIEEGDVAKESKSAFFVMLPHDFRFHEFAWEFGPMQLRVIMMNHMVPVVEIVLVDSARHDVVAEAVIAIMFFRVHKNMLAKIANTHREEREEIREHERVEARVRGGELLRVGAGALQLELDRVHGNAHEDHHGELDHVRKDEVEEGRRPWPASFDPRTASRAIRA